MKKEKRQANVPPLRFPEFSGEEWKKCRLSEICSFFSGGTPSSSKKEYYDGDIPFIRSGELHEEQTELFITEAGLKNSAAKMVEVGDLLLALYGATSGDIAISKMNGAINQAILCIRTKQNKKFIESIWHKHVRRLLQIYLQGGQGNLSADIVKNISFSFACIEEQEKLAKFISLLDERISTQNKIIEDLEQLKSALTDQLYSGQLRFHEFADDWGVSTFGHLTEHFSHRNRNSKHYPVFSVTKDTGFIPQEEQFESREIAGDDISSYKIIRQGEFAYNPARINVGSIARYDNETPCLISSLYVCIKPAADIDSDWLLYLLKSKRAIFYYNLYGEGGVRIYLFYPNFSRIKVKVPSIQEQHRIAALLKYIADKILQEKKLKDLYITQKQFLLQRMFI